MKLGKLITYNLLTFLLAANTFYLYFGGGSEGFSATQGFIMSILPFAVTVTILFVLSLLVTISYIAVKAKTRKILLKISLATLVVMLVISIIGRIIEIYNGVFCYSCWVSTLLYIGLLVLVILILKDLYRLIRHLVDNSY